MFLVSRFSRRGMTAPPPPLAKAYALPLRRTNVAGGLTRGWEEPPFPFPRLIGGWQVAQKNVERCAWTIRRIVPPHVWQGVPASP